MPFVNLLVQIASSDEEESEPVARSCWPWARVATELVEKQPVYYDCQKLYILISNAGKTDEPKRFDTCPLAEHRNCQQNPLHRCERGCQLCQRHLSSALHLHDALLDEWALSSIDKRSRAVRKRLTFRRPCLAPVPDLASQQNQRCDAAASSNDERFVVEKVTIDVEIYGSAGAALPGPLAVYRQRIKLRGLPEKGSCELGFWASGKIIIAGTAAARLFSHPQHLSTAAPPPVPRYLDIVVLLQKHSTDRAR